METSDGYSEYKKGELNELSTNKAGIQNALRKMIKLHVKAYRSTLKNTEIQKDKVKYRQAVQKVIGYMTLGIDVSSLFSEMIVASVTNDLVQKKLVYLYIRCQAESNKEIAILMISTLTKDAMDDNPMIRGLALRTMCELRLPNLLEYIKEPLVKGLQDKSVYVRKIAAVGVLKIFHFAPSFIQDHLWKFFGVFMMLPRFRSPMSELFTSFALLIVEMDVIKFLKGLLNDNDGQVFFNSLVALDEILADEGGIQVNRDLVEKIINRLHLMNELSQCLLISFLTRYKPSSQEEVIALLNSLDDRLKHANKGVVMATAKLFLLITKDVSFLMDDVYSRLVAPLLSVVSSSSPELAFTAFSMVSTIFKARRHLLAPKFKIFFLRESEPLYLKNLKLAALTDIVNESNMDSILQELRYRAIEPDVRVAQMATKCIGKIGRNNQLASDKSLEILVGLLELNLDHIIGNIFEAIKEILSRKKAHGNSIAAKISDYWDQATDSQSGKAALIWILGEFGEGISNSPYILEKITETLEQEHSAEIKLALLNASMRLFFQRPPEFQSVLGKILDHLIEDETNVDVHDRAMFYYRCLKSDINKAYELLMVGKKMIEDAGENTADATGKLEETFLKDFNTLYSTGETNS